MEESKSWLQQEGPAKPGPSLCDQPPLATGDLGAAARDAAPADAAWPCVKAEVPSAHPTPTDLAASATLSQLSAKFSPSLSKCWR